MSYIVLFRNFLKVIKKKLPQKKHPTFLATSGLPDEFLRLVSQSDYEFFPPGKLCIMYLYIAVRVQMYI